MWVVQASAEVALGRAPQRRRVAMELLVLAVLSSTFLALFPRRPVLVDLSLALFALGLVLLTAHYTRAQIWGQWPLEGRRDDWRGCVSATMTLTVCVILACFVVGAVIGYQGAEWPGVRARILHPYIPAAMLVYLPWALLQQTLFQFYLLGRLRALWPSLPVGVHSTLNGLIFGLVHTADVWIALPAALGGMLWSFLYVRYRRLWPLAVSHALIGTTFYYWVYGYDLAGRWGLLLRRLTS